MHHTGSSTQQDYGSNFRHDPVPLCMAKKWLPVSHRHGCAIYRHENLSAEQQDFVGGELMVSAIIKGSPEQCLAALTNSNSSNSILGPAAAVQVLQQSADGSSKVLQIDLEHPCSSSTSSAPCNNHSSPGSSTTTTTSSSSRSTQGRKPGSLLTRLCCSLLRRRCAVMQQTLWQDSRGIYCITFTSLTAEEQQYQQQYQQQQQQQQIHQVDLQHAGGSFSIGGVTHSHCNGNTLPAGGSRSLPGSGCDSCAVHTQQVRQQQHAQHQQQQQQQQLRHRGVSAPGHLSAKKQASQAVQLHACCHQQSSGDGSSSNSTHHQPLPTKSAQQSHPHHHQQQQQQQQQAMNAPLILQPLYLLFSGLGSLLLLLGSLMGFPCSSGNGSSSSSTSTSSSSSSSSACWGLLGPVCVSVVGGFTVAGLGGEDNGGGAAETLVTSILKVDLGGCLSSNCHGSCSLLRSAAERAGVVDALVNQMLSAVEKVKLEVEHPPTVQQQQQQQQRQQGVSGTADAAWLEGVVSNVTSVASMALAPLTTWLQGQRPQQQHQQQQQRHKHQLQQQHLQGKPDHHHHHRQRHPAAAAPAGQAGSVVGTRSSGGGKKIAAAAAATVSAAGAAVGSGDVAGASVDDLVGSDQQGTRLTGLCNPAFWSPLHQPGYPALFQVRGPNYLSDHRKVAAGDSAYTLLSVDLVSTPTAVHHLARYLPSVRRCRAASAFVINMMVPAASDVMNLVMTFGSSRPWPVQCDSNSSSSNRNNVAGSGSGGGSAGGSDNSSSDGSSSNLGGTGFENTLHRFLQSDDTERSNMFKMIPHIQVGPWVLQTMVGTTPVIVGRKLEATYHLTERYMEVDIDVTTCRTAGYIVQSIRGATTSLVVDLAYLLEGQRPNELPEELIGAVRFSNIDMSATTPLDVSKEIPSWPEPW